jgi:predicted nucleotidyltransferase
MIYTLEEIKDLIDPIAKKYQLKALWVFGSYARGEATEESDVDFLMDNSDSIALDLCGFIGIANEFEKITNKKVDLITIKALYGPRMRKYFSETMNTITNERVLLYEKS